MNSVMSGHWGEIEEQFIGSFCMSYRKDNSYFLKQNKKKSFELNLDLKKNRSKND